MLPQSSSNSVSASCALRLRVTCAIALAARHGSRSTSQYIIYPAGSSLQTLLSRQRTRKRRQCISVLADLSSRSLVSIAFPSPRPARSPVPQCRQPTSSSPSRARTQARSPAFSKPKRCFLTMACSSDNICERWSQAIAPATLPVTASAVCNHASGATA
jgi:hypothetical protein